jgi:hypothetical protein
MASKKSLRLTEEQFVEKRFDAALQLAVALLQHGKYEEEFSKDKGRRHLFYSCLKAADLFMRDSGISSGSTEGSDFSIIDRSDKSDKTDPTKNIVNIEKIKYHK